MALGDIRVVNKARGSTVAAEPGEAVIDCDRRGNPVLGNRHYLANKMDPHARALVIEANRKDLENDLAREGPMTQELRKIAARVAAGENVALACWCAPSRCHVDNYVPVIRQMAENLLSRPKPR